MTMQFMHISKSFAVNWCLG